jgi:hypothetical protein
MLVYVFFLSFFIRLTTNGFAKSLFGDSYRKHMACIVGLVLVGMFSELYNQIVNSPAGKFLLY